MTSLTPPRYASAPPIDDGARPEARPKVSVVLPCYRAAAIARRSIAQLRAYAATLDERWEIIVVDDGGGDFGQPDWVDDDTRLLTLASNRGKGAAVRTGMLAARGQVRVFTDVDLPYDPALIAVMADYILNGRYHLVVGDRTLPASRYTLDIGWKRSLASAVFSRFVGFLVTGGFFDTQCGLKAFRADVAEEIFRLTRIERFAFDVEVLYLGLLHRIDIKRIPVRLRVNETSSVRLFRDSSRMLLDVLRLKLYQQRGAYDAPRLAEITQRDFESVRGRACAVEASRQAP